ncbi:hypothetical protein [Aequorivita ciconiae]|nr:hypothetical protein [Aequorivita sp. H23M31]
MSKTTINIHISKMYVTQDTCPIVTEQVLKEINKRVQSAVFQDCRGSEH